MIKKRIQKVESSREQKEQKFWYSHIRKPPGHLLPFVFWPGIAPQWTREANIWPKMTNNANFWPNLAIFGPKILFFRNEVKILVPSHPGNY